jgi:hypothetical protein
VVGDDERVEGYVSADLISEALARTDTEARAFEGDEAPA